MPKEISKKVGRPNKLTPEIIKILEDAFIGGHSDEEACLLAGIGTSTLYDYCQVHPNFRSKKELLKNTPTIQARKNIKEAIDNKDLNTSKWYLERKTKEFKDHHDVTTDDEKIEGIQVTIVEDKRQTDDE